MIEPSRLVVFTGAGLSADSGIQTFRDSDGLWENHNVDQVANIYTFKKNFEVVHRFYNARRQQLAEVEPNAAHMMLARLQHYFGERMTLITQNIDDLLERAGCTDVLHVHGHLTSMHCLACGHRFQIGYRAWDPEVDTCPVERCRSKRGVKPNVVFFHENAPGYRPMNKALMRLNERDVLLVMGTSGQVIDIGSYAAMTKAFTILSNLKSEKRASMPGFPIVEDRQFNLTMHGQASEMAGRIEAKVAEILGLDPKPQ